MFNDILGKVSKNDSSIRLKNGRMDKLMKKIDFDTSINIAWKHIINDKDLFDELIGDISSYLNDSWGILEEDSVDMTVDILEFIFT